MTPHVEKGYVFAFPCPCCRWLRGQGYSKPEWSVFEPYEDDLFARGRCTSCNWLVPTDTWDIVFAGFILKSGYLSVN